MFINLIVLSVTDLEASKAFYSLFNLQFIKEQHDNSPCHYSCEFNGIVLELYPSSLHFPVEKSIRLGFKIDNLFLVKQRLLQNKIVFKENNHFVIVEDPDGRKIFLTQK